MSLRGRDFRSSVPWCVLGLIVVNLVGALVASLDRSASAELGFDPDQPSVFHALASLFLHANLVHLLGNLVFLAAVGPAVEFAGSWRRVLALYALGGAAGIAVHWGLWAATGPGPVLLGASAGIAALAGYAALRYARVRVPLAPGWAVPASVLAAAWVVLQAAGGLMAFGRFGGTSYASHLAGFLAGVVAAWLLRVPGEESREFGHGILDRMNERGPGATLAAADRHLAAHPHDLKARLARADALARLGEPEQAAAEWAEAARAGLGAESREAAMHLVRAGRASEVPAVHRLRLAEAILPDAGAAVALLEGVAADPSEPARPDALLALARLQEGEKRQATLAVLVAEYDMHPTTEVARRAGLVP